MQVQTVGFNASQTQNIQTIISTFAKQNKVSAAKLQSFADSIIYSLPKQGRPMLDKTKQAQDSILGCIKDGKVSTVDILQALTIDKVSLHNHIKALEKKKAIVRVGRVATGKRGRQPVIYSVANNICTL